MKMRSLVVFSACLLFIKSISAQSSDEKDLNEVILKVYPSCVRMYGYDTVKKTRNSAQFSGVVVTGQGHILTVAHAVSPNRIYKVTFPDGKECLAVALGRIANETDQRPDVAMMKILREGNWPFAELGLSSTLKPDQPCFGISYPESLAQLKPMVRFGAITNVKNEWGFIESSCIMETGDSGGPLFDLEGRVIGLHSRLENPEGANFEVPVDVYRKYWTALNTARNYTSLPSISDDVETDPFLKEIKTGDASEWMKKYEGELKHQNQKVVIISSKLHDSLQNITGTVFVKKGLQTNNKTNGSWVVSKNSMIGKDPMVQLADGKTIKAEIIFRDEDRDLVLLWMEALFPSAINLISFDTTHFQKDHLGAFLVSILPDNKMKQSVVGSEFFSLPARFSSGYFGANAVFKEGKVTLSRIRNGSPAEKEGLSTGDAILSINGVPLNQPEDYGNQLRNYWPGDKVVFQCSRADSSFEKVIELATMPQVIGRHPADRFEGGKSIRRDGFQTVFIHDARIRSYECGGPVFDIEGNFRGINIARFSHTTTVVIPAGLIYRWLKDNAKN